MNQLGTIKKAHIVWIFVTDVEIEFRNIICANMNKPYMANAKAFIF